MKRSCWPLGLLFFTLIQGAQAQTLDVVADGQAVELQCPAAKRPARRPSPPPDIPEDMVLEAPTLDELLEFLMAEPPEAQNTGLQLKHRNTGRPARIAFWGDSHLAANFFGEELVRLSGFRPQEVQAQFLPATLGRAGVRLPLRKRCQGGGWTYRYAYADPAHDGNFGPSLAQLHSHTLGSYLWIDFRQQADEPALRGVELQFALPPEDEPMPVLGITVDDGEEQIVATERAFGGLVRINADRALSVLRLRLVKGSVALEGFRPRYLETAALHLDTLAIPGATVQGWANVDPETLRARLGGADYDFVVLQYGTNEGNRRPFDAEAYSAELDQALTHLRQVFPEAQCVLIGPTDRGILTPHPKSKGKAAGKGKKAVSQKKAPRPKKPQPDLLRFARIHHEISDIQRSVGQRHQCAFWNWQAAMGGPGGAYRWLYKTPPLMARDLIHLTLPGYQQSARDFARDMHFTDWFSREDGQP